MIEVILVVVAGFGYRKIAILQKKVVFNMGKFGFLKGFAGSSS